MKIVQQSNFTLKYAASLIIDITILRKASYEIEWKQKFDTSLPTLYHNEQMKESSNMPKQVKGVDETDVVKSNCI